MSGHSRAQRVVTYDAAAAMVAAAVAHARAKGWTISVAVLDPSGEIVASGRMDGSAPAILGIATDKGYTATLGRPTLAFADRMGSSTELTLGLSNRPRFCAWQGGLPIREGGVLIGGIGVSGATGPEDEECAAAALAVLGLDPA